MVYAVLVSPGGRSVVSNHSRTHRKWLSAQQDLDIRLGVNVCPVSSEHEICEKRPSEHGSCQ